MTDIEDFTGSLINTNSNNIDGIGRLDDRPFKMDDSQDDKLMIVLQYVINEYQNNMNLNDSDLNIVFQKQSRLLHFMPIRTHLLYMYRTHFDTNPKIVKLLQSKKVRSQSGINNITVSLPGYYDLNDQIISLTCPHKCGMCPHVPGLPVSYMAGEPAVDRGLEIGFNTKNYIVKVTLKQLLNRYIIGILPDKLEIRFLGGTWHAFKEEYRYQVIRDVFYSANIFYDIKGFNPYIRPKLSLEEEQLINESSNARIIGICIETPPLYIKKRNLREARIQGITRLELGIQTVYDTHLRIIDRDFSPSRINKLGIKLAKNCGFKVIAHWMHDLPTSTRESDIQMNTEIFDNPYYDTDEIKFYANQTVDFTSLKERYDSGEFVHYSDQDLLEVSIDAIQKTPKHVRIIRFGRDTPTDDVYYGLKTSNFRQVVEQEMINRGLNKSKDVRAREVKGRHVVNPIMRCKYFIASDGIEYYISIESNDDHEILYAHLRLRISVDAGIDSKLGDTIGYQNVLDSNGDIKPEYYSKVIFPELLGCALIRELHTYGKMVSKSTDSDGSESQNQGFGEQLMNKAFEISRYHNCEKIAVISGNSVRNYYINKFGFELIGKYGYLIKDLYTYELNKLYFKIYDQKRKNYAKIGLIMCMLYAIHWLLMFI
jgi:elongator complex protein 3